MIRRRIRWVGMALVVVAVLSGVVITASTSTATADRSLSVAVADDTDAYVVIEDCAVRNQHPTNVIAEITSNGTSETVRLAPGEQYRIDTTGTVELTVSESSQAVETHLSRSVSCAEHSA